MTHHNTRRKARERALQVLFSLDFTKYEPEAVLPGYWEQNPARASVREYAEKLVLGVWERRAELDADIADALEHWTPERIGAIERAALRMALFEMRHAEGVPASAAINEALEIVKVFGADEAPRFVNGVLDRLRKKLSPTGE